ncbi:MAG: FG-GAP-like repeat-containing protein [Chitinophagaceae bacterium]
MYVGNDFHENDYLYINQHSGTFKEELTDRIMHTSQFSMGVDIADINNDAYPDIISLDMLPADPYILKRSLGENEYDIFNMKLGYGYNNQYTRNNLQLNRRNGMFSEVGFYAGVAATDWSWASLWMDFDNDGLKDLFISNGIPKRLNDMDYLNYVSSEEIQQKILNNNMGDKDMALIKKFPEIKLPNKFFKNLGNVQFKDLGNQINGDLPTFSNGAVYADLDNDGDLDVVVNNIDDPVLVYENKSNDKKDKSFIEIKVKGSSKNINAIGAKIIVYDSTDIRTYEKYPVRGFQSSMEIPMHIGLDKTKVDSILCIWPDNTYQSIHWNSPQIVVQYQTGLPKFDYTKLTTHWKNSSRQMVEITSEVNLRFKHEENPFVEFDREPLIPFMVSREGPALAVGDANGDGLDDVFIGSSKLSKSAVFFNFLQENLRDHCKRL